MLWPAEAVSGTAGVEIAVVRELPTWISDERPELNTDVVVFLRPAWRKTADAIPHLRDRGIAVCVDLDDDFAALHPDHRMHRHLDQDTNAGHLLRACAAADLVIAPTDQLLERYAPHGRAALVRNYLPSWALDAPIRRNGHTLGWSGIADDHPGDLEETGGAVAAVLRRTEARFHVVGPPEGVAARLGLDQPAWGTGTLSIHEYFDALGSIDVGIVPLAPSSFNAAKSPIKGMEYAAAGVPFVASPTPEYEWLADQGIGTLARTPKEWEDKLTELVVDDRMRRDLAEHGRRLVAERFLLESNAWRWPEAWEQARRNRHSWRSRLGGWRRKVTALPSPAGSV